MKLFLLRKDVLAQMNNHMRSPERRVYLDSPSLSALVPMLLIACSSSLRFSEMFPVLDDFSSQPKWERGCLCFEKRVPFLSVSASAAPTLDIWALLELVYLSWDCWMFLDAASLIIRAHYATSRGSVCIFFPFFHWSRWIGILEVMCSVLSHNHLTCQLRQLRANSSSANLKV